MRSRYPIILALLFLSAASFAADQRKRFQISRRTALRICAAAIGVPFAGLGVESLTTESDYRQNASFSKAPRDKRIDLAVVGDSLSSRAGGVAGGVTGMVATIYRDRNVHSGGWVMGASTSVYEQLQADHPVRVTNLARVGAYIDGEALEISRFWPNQIRYINNLSDQVAVLLDQSRFPVGEFPNHIVIWIGHNNMDWVWDQKEMINPQDKAMYVKMISRRVSAALEEKLLDLIGRASLETTPTKITLQGMFDFRNAYAARREVASIREKDPTRFPYFDLVPTGFPSMLPEYEEPTVKLVDATNSEFRSMVALLNEKLELAATPIALTYDDSFRRTPLNRAVFLTESDGFHFSAVAHAEIAKKALKGL